MPTLDPSTTQSIIADIAEGLNIAIQILNFLHTQNTPAPPATPVTTK